MHNMLIKLFPGEEDMNVCIWVSLKHNCVMYEHISMKCMHILMVTWSKESAKSLSLLAYVLHILYHPETQHINNDPINTHVLLPATQRTLTLNIDKIEKYSSWSFSIPNTNHSANFEVPTDIQVFCHVTLCHWVVPNTLKDLCLISNLMHKILIYLHIIHLLQSSTCFEYYPANLQEVYVLIVCMQPLVLSLSADDCIVHRLRKFFLNWCTIQSPAESDDTRGCIHTITT